MKTVDLREPGKEKDPQKTYATRHGYGYPQRIRDRMKELGEMQRLSLDDKIEVTKNLIRETLEKTKRPIIAWSGGKDSTLICLIAIEVDPNIRIVYADSTIEPIETLDYVETFSKEHNFNLTSLRAPTIWWQMVRTHGWPILGGDRFAMGGSWQNNAQVAKNKGDLKAAEAIEVAKISGACSVVVKVVPMNRHARYEGSNCTILGTMALETRQRMLVWLQKGWLYWHSGDKKWISWPIWFWKPSDVMEYFRSKNIRMCELYNMGWDRNGCAGCCKDWKWPDSNVKKNRIHHPKMWEMFMFEKGLAWRLWNLKKLYHPEHVMRYGFSPDESPYRIAEEFPEFYDSL